MIYIVDIDGTLCTYDGMDVHNAKPYPDRITKINRLYEQGHKIHLDSARGTLTGSDMRELTEQQLREWGVKYHTLRTGVKLYGDYYLDDRALTLDFFK